MPERFWLPILGMLALIVSVGFAPSVDDKDDDELDPKKIHEKQFREYKSGLEKALRNGNTDLIAYWVEQLGSLQDPKAMELILRVGERHVDDTIREMVLNVVLWAQNSPSCMTFFVRQLQHPKKVERAIILVDALDRMAGEQATEGLIAALDIRDDRVRTGAVRALRHKPTREAVDAVLRLYEKVLDENDLLTAETRITLLTLTDQQYTVYEDWANWWVVARDTWKPKPQRKSDEGRARTAVYRPEREYELPQIFGQEVVSKRVVFVIDTSQSMQKADPIEGEEGSGGGSRVRIDRARNELIKAVLKLRKDARFGLVAYDTYGTPWPDEQKLVPATRSKKNQAVEFVRSWKADGHTNTLEAMLQAMAYPEVDTIILLSDGSPTVPGKGTITEIEPILEKIREENRFKKITIHTLGFEGAKVSFMKALAKQNDGTYAAIK